MPDRESPVNVGELARRQVRITTLEVVGLAYAEAALVCRVPIGTIRSRVARAREDLQAGLGEAT